jgi:TRAP-type C4-dicarboxylate transport system substrate-binding protein
MINRRVFVTAAAAATACGQVHSQTQPTPVKMANGYKPNSFQTENLAKFAQTLSAAGIPIEFHPNNSLVKLSEIPNSVREGKIQLGETIMSNMVKESPLSGADGLPFVVRSYSDSKRLWKYQKPLIVKQFAQIGLVPLMAVPWPAQCLYTDRPIQRASDLKGITMRTAGPASRRIVNHFGANPVEVAMVDVSKALREKRLNAMITSASTGVDNQVWTHFKYFYRVNAWYPKNITYANAAWFNSLSPQKRNLILREAELAEARGWDASVIESEEAVKELAANGIKIEPSPHEMLFDLKRIGEKFALEWVREVGQDANEIFIPYFFGEINSKNSS